MFRAEKIGVVRDGREILRDVSVALAPGKLTVVLGANGAGKSTLLQALSGGIVPDTGTVFYGNTPLGDFSEKALAQRRAVLMQHTQLSFDFKVAEIVAFGRLPWRDEKTNLATDSVVSEVLLQVGLPESFWQRRFSTLSGGEQQRVQIARLLAQAKVAPGDEAKYALFLDEPTSALDLTQAFEIMRHALLLARKGYAVFSVLHDLNLALLFADEVILMRAGTIVDMGPTGNVLIPSKLQETFGIKTELFNGESGSFIHILG